MRILSVILLLLHLNILTICVRKSGVYMDNGFDQTIVHEVLSDKERVELEQEMLNLLGLPEKPQHTRRKLPPVKRSAPLFLMSVYKIIDEDGYAKSNNINITDFDVFDITGQDLTSVNNSDTIISFAAQSHRGPGGMNIDRVKRLWFDVTQVSSDDEIINAELRLYRTVKNLKVRRNQGLITISVHRIVRNDEGKKEFLFVDAITTTEKDGWVVFNITESLNYWVHNPKGNRGLYLAVHAHDGRDQEIRPEEVGIVGFRGDIEKQPFMVGYFKRRSQRRIFKRKTEFSPSYGNSMFEDIVSRRKPSACKRVALYVSFKELNWHNWVIAPAGYDAYYCHGECSFPLHSDMNATNHAIVQTLVNLMDPSRTPKPCCTPSKLRSYSVVYMQGEDNFVMKTWDNMAVESCGCH